MADKETWTFEIPESVETKPPVLKPFEESTQEHFECLAQERAKERGLKILSCGNLIWHWEPEIPQVTLSGEVEYESASGRLCWPFGNNDAN